MQVNNETQSGFQTEIKIIPAWAWTLAAIGFLTMQILLNVVVARQPDAPPAAVRALLGGLTGIMVGCYMLFVGYVNRDSKRRGMSPAIWTCVALFIPNALGIIVYFVLRQPLRSACPQCGHAIQSGFNFCPQCNCKLSPNCPQCQRAVALTDIYCPYCGTGLRNQPATLASGVQR